MTEPDQKPNPSANDNAAPVTIADLATASGLDEDTLLTRLAGILSRREDAGDDQ